MTHTTDPSPAQFAIKPAWHAPRTQSKHLVSPRLQQLLTLSTGGILLSAMADAPAQSAAICQVSDGHLPLECADRPVAELAKGEVVAVNAPQPDRSLSNEAVPTFAETPRADQNPTVNAIHTPTVESNVAIAWSATQTTEPIVTAQTNLAPDVVEAESVDRAVENLQKSLNRAGFRVDVNGVFDQETQTALQQFKTQRGLSAEGIAVQPEPTSLLSSIPAGYARGQSLLLVQNTDDDEPSEVDPTSEGSDDEPEATDASEETEQDSAETEDNSGTHADDENSAETTDNSEDAEAEESTETEASDASEDNSAEDDTEEDDATAADEEPSETTDTDATDVEGNSDDADEDATEDEPATKGPPAEESQTSETTPSNDDSHAPSTMEPVDKSGTPEVTQPRSPSPAPSGSKKPDEPGGNLNNTATGTSRETSPQGDSADVPVVGHPVLGFNKTVTEVINPDGSIAADKVVDEAGDTVKYTMRVSNFGNVTLTGVAIADPLLKTAPAADVTLNVGDELFFQGEYTATQTDIDGEAAYIHNEATFSSHQTSPKTDGEAVPIRKTPALTVEKQATNIDRKNDSQLNAVDDIVDYEIVVTNTGNQTLTNVAINDSLIGNQSISQLAPKQSKTFIGQYTLTQQDIDSNGGGDGDIDNTVIAKADQVAPVEDFAEVELQQNPALSIEKRVLDVDKAGDGVINNAGEKIHYEVIVTNTGNQTLNNVIVTDPLLGGTIDEGFSLSPGDSKSYKLTYTVTQADLDNGGAPLDAPEFLNPSEP